MAQGPCTPVIYCGQVFPLAKGFNGGTFHFTTEKCVCKHWPHDSDLTQAWHLEWSAWWVEDNATPSHPLPHWTGTKAWENSRPCHHSFVFVRTLCLVLLTSHCFSCGQQLCHHCGDEQLLHCEPWLPWGTRCDRDLRGKPSYKRKKWSCQ